MIDERVLVILERIAVAAETLASRPAVRVAPGNKVTPEYTKQDVIDTMTAYARTFSNAQAVLLLQSQCDAGNISSVAPEQYARLIEIARERMVNT